MCSFHCDNVWVCLYWIPVMLFSSTWALLCTSMLIFNPPKLKQILLNCDTHLIAVNFRCIQGPLHGIGRLYNSWPPWCPRQHIWVSDTEDVRRMRPPSQAFSLMKFDSAFWFQLFLSSTIELKFLKSTFFFGLQIWKIQNFEFLIAFSSSRDLRFI